MDSEDPAAFNDWLEPSELVRESNHRIANQLTLLVGMIQLRIDGLKRGPDQLSREEAMELLRNAASRIVAIGHLHRHLALSGHMQIELGPFLSSTRAELLASLSAEDRVRVSENLLPDCRVTGEQASVLALVMNEIIINALKYAHPDGLPVAIALSCEAVEGGIVVKIADDGIGLPDGFDERRHGGVGFKLIRSLIGKIGAALDLQSGPLGLCFRIIVPSG